MRGCCRNASYLTDCADTLDQSKYLSNPTISIKFTPSVRSSQTCCYLKLAYSNLTSIHSKIVRTRISHGPSLLPKEGGSYLYYESASVSWSRSGVAIRAITVRFLGRIIRNFLERSIYGFFRKPLLSLHWNGAY
jgi:hypothetical protein